MSNYWNKTPRRELTAVEAWEKRRREREARDGLTGHRIRLTQIADPDNLYYVAKRLRAAGGRAAGGDGVSGRDLSNPELGDLCRGIAARIVAGEYRPDPARVARIPKPGTAETRTLKLPTFMDRVVGKAVNAAFSPFWERRFRALSYGFRPKKSVFRMLADLEVAVRRSRYTAVAVADIRKAFDHVPVGPVLDLHRDALGRLTLPEFGQEEQDRTLGLVEAVVRGHDAKRRIGIDQGAPYSPTALNVLLNEVHDKRVAASLAGAKPAGVAHRYADNMAYVVPDVAAGRTLLAQVGGLLEPAGLALKADAAVYNVTAGEPVPLLGFTLRWVAKTMTVGLADAAYEHLALALAHVKLSSQTPAETARATILGWVAAAGPAYADGLTVRVTEIAVRPASASCPKPRLRLAGKVVTGAGRNTGEEPGNGGTCSGHDKAKAAGTSPASGPTETRAAGPAGPP